MASPLDKEVYYGLTLCCRAESIDKEVYSVVTVYCKAGPTNYVDNM